MKCIVILYKNRLRLLTAITLVLVGCIQGVYGQNSVTYSTAGTHTFTVPAGVTSVTVEAWGGGGAGGGSTSNRARGGGGGAGGSYVKKDVPVVSGDYTVTVGSGAIGTTNAGEKGSSSWFSTVGTVYAEGGAGGAAPNGGNVDGGIGSVSGCIGDIMTAGGNGSGGTSSSGGAGGKGATSNGGNGGSVLTTEGNGNAGNTPGGGGGGAYISDNTDHSGGSGAAGRVIISYTCLTYTINGISGTSACRYGTSTITVSSAPSGLPVGTYTVTYDRSNPSVSGLTAIMQVTTAGTGIFTASGFNNTGSSIITIRSLSSGLGVGSTPLCNTLINSNNTASIIVTSAVPSQSGVITGNATPCEGSSQTYSVPNVAGVSYDWVLPAGWTQTGGGNSNSITVTVGSTSGDIQVTPFNGCGNGAARTLAVNVTSINILGFPGSRCGAGTGVITLSAWASAGTIKWYNSNGIYLSSGSTFTTPVLATNATYYAEATNGSCTSARIPITAYIITPPTLTASGGGTYCSGVDVNLNSTLTGADNAYWEGPSGYYSNLVNPILTNITPAMSGLYIVNSNALSGINLITNGDFELGNTGFGSAYTNSTDLLPEGTYAVVASPNSVHAGFSSCADHSTSGNLQMVINGAVAPEVTVWSQTVNVVPNTYYQFTYWIQSVVGSNPSELQLYVNGVSAGPVYTAITSTCNWSEFLYNWSSNSNTSALLELRNQNINPNGNDFALDDIVFQHTCTSSASVNVTVNADVTSGSIAGAQSICRGETPVAFSSSAAGTGAGTITYEWETNASGSYVTVAGATAATYSPPALNSTTSYRRRTVSNSGGATCHSGYSNVITITVNGPIANAGGPNYVCQSSNPSAISLSGASFGGGATSAAWSIVSGGGSLSSTAQTTIPSAVTYTPAANYSGVVKLVLTTSGGGGCNAISERIINVIPSVTAVAGTAIATCSNSGAVNITAGSSASNYASVVWTSDGTGTFNNASSLMDATYTPSAADIAAGRITLTLTATGNFPCGNAVSTKTITINANPSAPIVEAITQPTCDVPTGSVTLSGLPSWSWTLTINPGGAIVTGTGSSTTISGLAPGTAYTFSVSEGDNSGVFGAGTGLVGSYFNNMTLSGSASLTRVDATVDFNWATAVPATGINVDGYSVRWTGMVQPETTGVYTFSTNSDDGIRLWIGGTRIISNWTNHAATINTGTITLTAGEKYPIVLEYYENTGGAVAQLFWTPPGQSTSQIIPQSQLYPVVTTGCNSPESGNVVIDAVPTPPSTPVVSVTVEPTCAVPTGTITVTSPSGATYEYQLDGGTYQASSSFTGVANGTHTIKVRLAASPTCISPESTVTLYEQPLPTVTISPASITVCQTAPSPEISFTNPKSLPIRMILNVTGVGDYTIDIPAGSLVKYPVPTATAGNFIISNIRVSYLSGPACEQILPGSIPITISPLPVATFSYAGNPYCSNQADPFPTFSGGGVSGTFSSTSGLIFISTATGQINLSASTPGTYVITNTIAASGACSMVTASSSVTILPDGSWTGTVDRNWNNPANWACNQLPTLTTNVTIANGLPRYPIVSTEPAGMAHNIFIGSNATVTVTGGTLQIAGSIANSGIFTATEGTIEMKGSAPQTIGANVFSTNTLKNLIINNEEGVTLAGPLNITGVVSPLIGNLSSGGHLTLLSTPSQTALIDGVGTGNVVGNVNIQRYLSSSFGYKYFSSPFQSAAVGAFATLINLTETFPTFYKYDENNSILNSGVTSYKSGWVKYTTFTDPLIPMAGYAANMGSINTPQTFTMSGVVNNGPQSLTLYNHNREYTKGFNLVGNPYPSPINWNALGWTKDKIDNAIYFFNAGNTDRYTGVYSSYVNGISSGNANNIIAAMQGFFVHVSDGTYPVQATLGMTNAVRINTLTPVFKSAVIDNRPTLRLTAGFEIKDAIEDAAVVYFDPTARVQFEKEKDALKLDNTDELVPNIYTITPDSRKLSINGLSEPSDSVSFIPLGITTFRDGLINFRAVNADDLPFTQVYLADAVTGQSHNLRQSPDVRFTLQRGVCDNRFKLVFSKAPFRGSYPGLGKLFMVVRSGNRILVKVDLPDTSKGYLLVTNLLGQTIMRREVTAKQTVEINQSITTGVYVITLVSGKRTESEKILMRHDYE